MTDRALTAKPDSPVTEESPGTAWRPKTELGRKLAARRAAALTRGMKLMSLDEINAEIASGRRK